LKQPIFKRKKGFANLSLGLIFHSKALPQPPSRDTVPLRKFDDNKFNQFCAFKLLTTKPLNIILIYRPPNSGSSNTDELCKLIDNADNDTIIIGNFNYPEIKWHSNTTKARSQPLLDVKETKQMQQMVHFPTHLR
jgi:hypothetical protein